MARRAALRRIDHASIVALIAATYTPIAVNVLLGWWRTGIVVATWATAVTGVGVVIAGVL